MAVTEISEGLYQVLLTRTLIVSLQKSTNSKKDYSYQNKVLNSAIFSFHPKH